AETRGGNATGRSVKGTIQWVSAEHSLPCEVRLYDRLFSVSDPDAEAERLGVDWKTLLNAESLVALAGARIETAVANDEPGTRYQFERVGYFTSDIVDSRPGHLVYNRTVSLRESFSETPRPVSEGRPTRGASDRQSDARTPHVRAEPQARSTELTRRMQMLVDELGIDSVQADMLTRSTGTANLFDVAIAAAGGAGMANTATVHTIANWIVNELPRAQRHRNLDELALTGAQLASLIGMVEKKEITSAIARDVLAELVEEGGDPSAIVARRNLRQVGDVSELEPMILSIIADNDDRVRQYRAGRTGLLGFFVGQVMAQTQGRANPQTVSELVRTHLEG
ncbi:MAG: glutamine--tRNA ligase, partial [Longimicrobiales bacterium]